MNDWVYFSSMLSMVKEADKDMVERLNWLYMENLEGRIHWLEHPETLQQPMQEKIK